MLNNASPEPANSNGPLLELRDEGDGRVFYSALARVIVRRELISMGMLSDPERCEDARAAS